MPQPASYDTGAPVRPTGGDERSRAPLARSCAPAALVVADLNSLHGWLHSWHADRRLPWRGGSVAELTQESPEASPERVPRFAVVEAAHVSFLLRRARPIPRILAVADSSSEAATALRLGAADAIVAPFGQDEFSARLDRLVGSAPCARSMTCAPVTAHPSRREISVRGQRVELRRAEYALLEYSWPGSRRSLPPRTSWPPCSGHGPRAVRCVSTSARFERSSRCTTPISSGPRARRAITSCRSRIIGRRTQAALWARAPRPTTWSLHSVRANGDLTCVAARRW